MEGELGRTIPNICTYVPIYRSRANVMSKSNTAVCVASDCCWLHAPGHDPMRLSCCAVGR